MKRAIKWPFSCPLYLAKINVTVTTCLWYPGGLGASVILGDLDHSKYLGKLITYLDPALPSASRTYFERCWHAKTDGWNSSIFHSNCDEKGPTVTIIKVGQYIFGGYTDTSWQSKYTVYLSLTFDVFFFLFIGQEPTTWPSSKSFCRILKTFSRMRQNCFKKDLPALPPRNFFLMFILLISYHTLLLVQFRINLNLNCEAEAARAISAFRKTHSCKLISNWTRICMITYTNNSGAP